MTTTKGLEHFKLPRWNDLPSVDLYLEQVLALLEEWLGEYLSIGDKKIMTKTMINNYVKLQYIKAPENRKYDKLTVACIFVIAILKPVYTIEEISRLIRLALNSFDPPQAFDQFCQLTESAVSHTFNHTTMTKTKKELDPRDLFWNVCNSFACQLYVRYIYLHK